MSKISETSLKMNYIIQLTLSSFRRKKPRSVFTSY